MLQPSPDAITPGGGLWGGRLLAFGALPSTNDWAMTHAGELHHGDLVQTAHQTAGRGRLQRAWVTPPGLALTLSVLLDPHAMNALRPSWIGAAAAIAIRDLLREGGVAARVKWPNDVLVSGRKIAGILVERSGATGPVVLGLGINLNQTAADLDAAGLRQPATSWLLESGQAHRVASCLPELRSFLESTLPLATASGQPRLAEAWARHDALAGHHVRVDTSQGTIQGEYLGMDADGALLLRDPSGATRTLLTGDASALRITPPG